jgi:membrane-associated phospholipid phosphatase
MMLGYFSYYFLIGVPLLVLFVKRRDRDAAQLTWALSLAFFVSYLGFIIYPVQGPRFEFAGIYQHDLEGFLFVPLVGALMKTAAIHGGCMPSSHVAAALVSLFYLFKFNRRWGRVCVIPVTLLCLGTVWGRFHYLSDVVVGTLIAAIVLWITTRYPINSNAVAPAMTTVSPARKPVKPGGNRA